MRAVFLLCSGLLGFSVAAYGESVVERGYVFHIQGSGGSCDSAKLDALEKAENELSEAADPSFSNGQVANKVQSVALCAYRSGLLGFTVTPSDPIFAESWRPDLTGSGRTVTEDPACALDVENGSYHTSNSANGVCLSQAERDNPPAEE